MVGVKVATPESVGCRSQEVNDHRAGCAGEEHRPARKEPDRCKPRQISNDLEGRPVWPCLAHLVEFHETASKQLFSIIQKSDLVKISEQ